MSAYDSDAHRYAVSLSDAVAAYEAGDEIEETDPETYLQEMPLEVVRNGRNSGNGWTVDTVDVVITTGGPHVEVVFGGSAGAYVAHYWGSESSRSYLPGAVASTLADVWGIDYLMDGGE